MRPPIPGRRALFDIGIAGPIAGFVVAIPVLVYGVATAPIAKLPDPGGMYVSFGDPLLLMFLSWMIHGPVRDGWSLVLNPATFAGWFGLLVTSMNLFPVGQLDGGHVSYALSRRLHPLLSRITAAGMIVLVGGSLLRGVLTPWLLWTLVLFLLSRFPHPPVIAEEEPIGMARVVLAGVAVLIFALCFVPVPMELISVPR
jgi:membrane-associated protease RseP (regulator of RpoE activity)